jgi:hypothetical protein
MRTAGHIGLSVWTVFLGVTCAVALAQPCPAAPPKNLARTAAITASSEFSRDYAAANVADGHIPGPMSHADVGKAWATKAKHTATLTFEWPEPVTVAEIVYWGRTAWEWEENFKACAVHLDGAERPAVEAALKAGHGPQRIRLPEPARVRRLTLDFASSYGGSNPGASEIGVYAAAPPEKILKGFHGPNEPAPTPVADSPDLARRLKAGELGFEKMLVIERHRVTSSHVYTYHCEGQRNGGGLYVYDVTTGDLTPLVDAPDGQILDCDVSWNGREILFSWRRGSEPYQVYRIGADGSDLTQLTDGDAFNFNACWLPDGGVAFLSTRAPQFAYCWTSPVGVLYRMERDGSRVRRLSANYLNDFTPTVMNDGRIIYGRWEYVDRPAIPIQGLWTINPDGTMLAQYYGNRVLGPATFIDPQPVPGSGAVLCTMTGHNGSCGGAVGLINPIYGDNTQAAIRNLTPEINHGRVDHSNNGPASGPYQTPYPLDETYFLVSYKGHVLVRDYEGTQTAEVLASRGIGWRNARPLRPRRRPPVRPSSVPDEPAAEEGGPWASVYLQDVHLGLGPHVARGEVKQVAVVQEIEKSRKADVARRAFGFQFPVVSCGATYAPKKVWGYADVAEDGSASFRVPAGVPIYFMALDKHGRAVQRMRSFTHFMPGEVQGCIGCHERRTESPRVSRLGTTRRPPQPLRPPEWDRRGFDYAGIVQPVLDAHCVRCHKPPDPPKGVDLTGDATDFFSVSYEVLARRKFDPRWGGRGYTRSISTYNGAERNILEITPKVWGSPASPLADLVLAGHPDADGRPRIRLTDAERRRLFAWIDLNVPYYGTSLARDYERQGCRRLYPPNLDKVLADVAGRRCAECHDGGKVPRKAWIRVARPQFNAFLLAPLARSAGGTEACGRAVFPDTSDPDYRAILETFAPVREALRQGSRVDIAAAVASGD